MTVEFKILGTGAGPGVPSYYCDCIACREAEENPRLARTRSGAVIRTGRETILIDASADLRSQLVREKIKEIDYVFMSHWHYDHFGGLGDLEFYVKLHRQEAVKLYLPPEAVAEFQAAYPFLRDVFEVSLWQFEEKYQFENLTLTPLPARHSTLTAGFVLESGRKAAYFTDTSGLPDSTAARIKGTDYLICDATFHGDNWYPHSHMSIKEAIKLGRDVEAKQTILTHLAMHYSEPVTVTELENQLRNHPGVSLAYDGMTIDLNL
ncbi:MAG: MBL fold metallo-hydrolase [Dehalobacter sp.]|nr:MBL fold metallo-hydrolase [Dehalobacter sp.]